MAFRCYYYYGTTCCYEISGAELHFAFLSAHTHSSKLNTALLTQQCCKLKSQTHTYTVRAKLHTYFSNYAAILRSFRFAA